MIRFFALSCCAVGVVLTIVGLVAATDRPAMLLLALLGGLIAYFSASFDNRRDKSLAEKYQQETKLRTEKLSKASWAHGKRLEIRTGKTIFLAMLFGLFFGAFLIYGSVISPDAPLIMWIGGTLISLVFLVVVLQLLPSIGKPALVLSLEGFETPAHGLIPWREVGGVYFEQFETSGGKRSVLNFRVDSYARTGARLHWTVHLLGLFGLGVLKRKMIVVLLNGASEPPETVAAITRLLWEKSTGMNYEWNPNFSDEYNQAEIRVQQSINRWRDSRYSPEEVLNNQALVSDMLNETEQLQQDLRVMESESRRYWRKSTLQMVVVVLVGIAFFVWQILSQNP